MFVADFGVSLRARYFFLSVFPSREDWLWGSNFPVSGMYHHAALVTVPIHSCDGKKHCKFILIRVDICASTEMGEPE